MARSDTTGRRPSSRSAGPVSLSRYDLVLAVIPSAFLVALLLGHVLAIPARTALFGASVVGGLALFDALFVNPPRGPDPGRPSG